MADSPYEDGVSLTWQVLLSPNLQTYALPQHYVSARNQSPDVVMLSEMLDDEQRAVKVDQTSQILSTQQQTLIKLLENQDHLYHMNEKVDNN